MKNRKTKKLLKNTTRRCKKQDKNKGGSRSYSRNNIYKQPLLKNNNRSLLNILYNYFMDWLERKNNTKKKLIHYNKNKLANLYSMSNTISQQIKQPQIKEPIFNNTLLIPTQKIVSQKQDDLEEFARSAFSNNKNYKKNAIRLNKIHTPKPLNNSDYLAYIQPINSIEKEIREIQQKARNL